MSAGYIPPRSPEELVRLIDPEPGPCGCLQEWCALSTDVRAGRNHGRFCGCVRDPMPRARLADYRGHLFGCPWGAWAMREIARIDAGIVSDRQDSVEE